MDCTQYKDTPGIEGKPFKITLEEDWTSYRQHLEAHILKYYSTLEGKEKEEFAKEFNITTQRYGTIQ